MGLGRLAHQTSPRFMADSSKLGSGQGGIDRLLLPGIYGVESLGHERILPLAKVFLESLRVELTAGHAQAMGKLLRSGEDRVRERDGDFHGRTVSPWYEHRNARCWIKACCPAPPGYSSSGGCAGSMVPSPRMTRLYSARDTDT